MNNNELFKKLVTAIRNGNVEKPEPGFKSAEQWCKDFGVSRFVFLDIASKSTKLGLCERKDFFTKTTRAVKKIPYYKFTA